MAKSMRQGLFPGMEAETPPDVEPAVRPKSSHRERKATTQHATEPVSELVCAAPDTLEEKSVWVVDANSLIFQVFHALPEMTSPRGEPVSAVFGFTRDMLYLLEEKKPDYLFVAFDASEHTFRHEVYEQYKAQRSEMPVDLVPQYEHIRRLLAGLGVPILEVEGYEADDLLATIAREVGERDGQCYLVTGDKDARQLITERTWVYNVRKNQAYDAAALKADWGIRPEQVVDFQALVGDSVDNVPGVPLVGPKIAGEYLQKYDSLDNLLEHVDELPKGKRRENLIAWREQALMSRQLVRLERHVPVHIDWEAGRVSGVDRRALESLFAELGFHTLAQKFAALPERRAEVAWQVDYQTIDTPERLAWLTEQLTGRTSFALSIETIEREPRLAEIVGLALAWQEGQAYYLPVQAPLGDARLDLASTLDALRGVLENPAIEKIGQNLKRDIVVLREAGVRLAGARFDGMIASYLLDAGERNHGLDELAVRYLGHHNLSRDALLGTGRNLKRLDEVPVAQAAPYAAEKADVVLRLRPKLAAGLREAALEKLFDDVEMPLSEVLADMESAGVRIDTALLADLSRQYGAAMQRVEREIYEIAGREFNIGSPKQLAQVLFEEHQLPVLKRTKSGGSTDADVLEELAKSHPLPAKIVEYRQYSKLKSTYVDALPQLVHPRTLRVHTSFNQVVAATGRLSSHDPNLQNIPVRSQRGREIRAAFLPGPPGWKLLAADYSQIELRVLAHFSQDPTLCAAFANDEDIHARVASQVYGVPLHEVTSDMRRQAKAVNFGVIYGQSPFGLAKQLDIEKSEAAAFIDAYFQRYRGVERFLERILEECPKTGYVSTILGRRRAIRGIRRVTSRQRNLPERTAINTVIQGSAADLIKLAMINIQRRLQDERSPARMLLQIHDELVFEVPQAELAATSELVRGEMAQVMELSVPLKVDLKTGDNWADCQEW
jgi:DNA polymerase-1